MRNFFKQYIPYYKNYIPQFLLAFFGMILVALGSSGSAYIIQPLLDKIFIAKDEKMLQILPFFVVGLYFAKGLGTYIQIYYTSYIGQDIIRIIRNKLLEHTLKLDIDFFQKKHGGELISRITNDINKLQSAVSNYIAEFFREIFTIMALVGVVIYQSHELAFYGLVVMPLAVYPLSLLAKRMKKLSCKAQESISDITTHLSETFNNIEIIKANTTEELENKKFREHNKIFFEISMKAVKTNTLTSPLMETLGAFAIAIVIIIGGRQVIHDELSVGAFFSFIAALFMLYTPIKRVASIYNKMQEALASNDRINDILKLKPTIINGNLRVPENLNTICLKNVLLKYDDKIALENISLAAKIGETIALIGDSGGGKSSLVNLIARFFDATSGEILFNNISIKNLDIKNLRENISIVTQRVYIFNDTVAANIAYGNEVDESKIIEVLRLSHAYDFVQNLPQGIHTKLDEFGTNLSGGQRQRIAIARALYKNPKILILDEATSALDNESESIISEVIEDISKDKITFIIAHRLSTIKHAKKIAVFKTGKIVGFGSEEELQQSCSEYRRLYNLANI